jgi:hypothetical protein
MAANEPRAFCPGLNEPISGLPCEARFWDWKLGPAKAHYLQGPVDLGEPHI